jgi:serine/threonine protein phosphatase PrpC
MSWKFSLASDIGGRSEQQDCLEMLSSEGDDIHLVVVADGMGGHRDGALAARTVIETAKRRFNSGPVPDPRAFLHELCLESHHGISAFGRNESRSPGSTCVVLYVNGPEAYWAHVGDSRLYHFRNGKLFNRTQDHSVAQLMVAQGRLEESEAARSALQNQLYMRLGGNEIPDPDFGASEVESNDVFMLCSDGFWSSVEPHEVVASMQELSVDDDVAGHLVEVARERGGAAGDNISLVLMRWVPDRVASNKGVLARVLAMMIPDRAGTASIRRLRLRIQSLLCR